MVKEETIKIGGMTCKSCSELIRMKVSALKGVKEIKVDLIKNNALVRFDPGRINLEQIKTEIASLGYSVDGVKSKKSGALQGLAYGLIPHIGCIAFIIGSVLGVTILMNFFKPILMKSYFFYALMGVSLVFAGISSVIYLKRNGFWSIEGAKRKKGYIATMFGSTIGINIVLFMIIFPLLANSGSASLTGAAIGVDSLEDYSTIKLKVKIPCPGHAPLISGELKSLGEGIIGINFDFPNKFNVVYDPEEVSKEDMLELEVFDEYPATVLEESDSAGDFDTTQTSVEGGSCCGGSSCGASTGGSCGCGGY